MKVVAVIVIVAGSHSRDGEGVHVIRTSTGARS